MCQLDYEDFDDTYEVETEYLTAEQDLKCSECGCVIPKNSLYEKIRYFREIEPDYEKYQDYEDDIDEPIEYDEFFHNWCLDCEDIANNHVLGLHPIGDMWQCISDNAEDFAMTDLTKLKESARNKIINHISKVLEK